MWALASWCSRQGSTVNRKIPTGENCHSKKVYDRVSDVVENGVSFASKILTHNRMH